MRAIAIGEKTLGPDHPDLATKLTNRVKLLYAQVGAVSTVRESNVGPANVVVLSNRSCHATR